MRRAFIAVGALVLASGLAGCGPGSGNAGFADISLNFLRSGGDIYRLNAVTVDELRTRGAAVVREPAGTVRLELERLGRLYTLCDFTVRKDRIVTVAVRYGGGGFGCEVKD